MKKTWNFRFLLLLVFFLSLTGNFLGQNQNPLLGPQPDLQKQWVDSIYDQMSLEQKVGQLFMIDVNSGGSDYQKDQVERLVQEHHVGGVIFSKGGPLQQAHLNNRLQETATVPLLIGMDAEWGLAMRLDSINAFPWNMTLGAIQDLRLIEQTGAAISKNLRRLGVHMNFAPVLDINTNPSNPIIGNRSFGENKENVSRKAIAFLKGMDRENILASGKHFPGHGDTNTDSHETLPTVGFHEKRLDSVELYPYRQLINQGLSGVMVGHLSVPALEKNQHLPASLSKSVVTGLLKEKIGFHGLIITDALNMKGASINAAPGGVSLAAFMAGNDILLMPKSISKATEAIINAYKNGVISEDRLRYSVEKILYAKYKVGLHEYSPVDTRYLVEELNTINNTALNHQLFEHSQTVVKNRKKLIPVKDLQDTRIAYINLGDGEASPFYEQLTKYGKVDWIKYNQLEGLLEKLEEYNRVIIGFHKNNASPWGSFRFTENDLLLLQEISRQNNVILSVFTSPYALQQVESLTSIEGIVVGYQNHPLAQEKAAQVIFGGLEAKGKLPVTAGIGFPEGHGLKTENLGRLTYGLPENVGVNSYKLRKIDSLINVTVEKKMSPGVQVLIARKGKVIYHKTAGYHTYDKKIPVSETDVYDLASLTKILGTLPLLIELVDKDELDFDTRLAEIIPSFEGSNKANVSIQRMLSHYARFQPWIPFHWATLMEEGNDLSPKYYRDKPIPGYSTKVAEGMYIRNDMRDSIVRVIRDSDLQRKMEYRYSDLPYYLLKHFLEKTYGASLDYLTKKRFYEPLGANYTTYLPLNHFPKEQIVPTEDDTRWRNQLLHGYVHDEGAALIGGVAGHAGLFSNSNDIAKMMQMYLNGGEYGGVRFFSKETFDKFNTCHYCHEEVRRGIGFDKPQLNEAGPTCGCVSMSSFGHSGFTGTFAWADPHDEIVYVFLSNRIHPSAENNELGKESIRSKIQEAIYDAIDY